MKHNTISSRSLAPIAALTLCLSLLPACERTDNQALDPANLHTVAREVVSERVLVAGTIRPSDVERVRNEVGTGSPPSIMLKSGFKEEYPTLIYIIEEGAEVKKGDLLFEVQSDNLEHIRYEREYYMAYAKSNVAEWSERLAYYTVDAEADMLDATLDLQFAKTDLAKYKEGDSPLALQNYKDALTRATNRAEQAQDEYNQSIKLAANGYITPVELEADKLLAQERQLSKDIAQAKLELFESYTYPRQVLQMERQVALEEVGMLRTKVYTQYSVEKGERYVKLYQEKLIQYEERLAYITKMIEDTKIYAPTSGTVIYAGSNGAGRALMWKPPAQEGDMLYPLEELVHIISSDRRHISIKLMEMDLSYVEVGQQVQVTAESMPDQTFTGVVSEIDFLATQGSMFSANPKLRQYKARIDIQGNTAGLKPGMNCIAEIIIDQTDNVTAAPVQAIAQQVDPNTGALQNIIYILGAKGPEPRQVTLGLQNELMAQITQGLQPGDQILLTPPNKNLDYTAPTDNWIKENRDRIREGITFVPREKVASKTNQDDYNENDKEAAKLKKQQIRDAGFAPAKVKKPKSRKSSVGS